ncbi:MAG TPA: type II secretion system F family protein [Actinomycetota bacterium]|jgi:type IV pilus assembly protein PilC|nr:type II secretion system F family protein [Actinomycetota bacterium]
MAQITYTYKVRDRQGRMIGGTLEADSQGAVATRLRQMGYAPISIEAAKRGGLKMEISLPGGGRVKPKDLAVFSRQFATMINSGLSLLRALTILAEQTANKRLATVIGEVRAEVEKGTALSVALAQHPKVFNRLYVAMIRSGEVGGFLDQVLLRVAETLEREVALRSKIKSAMTYPVVVFAMVLMIVSAMLVFIVPMFKNLYASLGGQLPLPTRILVGVSDVVKQGFPFVILGIILASFGFRRWIATSSGRYRMDAFKLKAPVFGPLFHKTALSRFSRTLATLLRSGVPILQSLEIVSETVNNGVLSKAVKDTQDAVREGESLAVPLAKHAVFPAMVVQMLAVGEETGALDTMLSKVADFYDQEVEAAVDALTSLIEPILIAVMGGAVGSMVIALYMPMFNIINLIK